MSDNEDFVRRLYATWNEHGPAAMVPDYWHRDIVWHDEPSMPDRTDHYGAAATIRYVESVIEAVGRMRVEVIAVEEASAGTLVEMTMAVEGQLSGVMSELPLFHVLTIGEGVVTEVQVFTDRGRARAAAGLAV